MPDASHTVTVVEKFMKNSNLKILHFHYVRDIRNRTIVLSGTQSRRDDTAATPLLRKARETRSLSLRAAASLFPSPHRAGRDARRRAALRRARPLWLAYS